ncbi:5-dehydro-2-deoxygluconokinase [Nocardioides sp.]|uniref:5-dehydro-2-deoxygluconokinase n=1 Tax=Nocardioides sp. TaxID=35761 RepID=UPI002602D94F|nr:5-dehydro-2-deoxygluconokinase [Nocardioides sp.]
MTLDVLTMGRVGIDLYPEEIGVGLADVPRFARFLGGSPTNVAIAAARYGRRSAVITKTGADPFGDYVRTALTGFGVDPRYVGTDPVWPTPITLCEIHPPDDFPLYFYRTPTAPDLQLRADELDLDTIAEARIFWVTLTGLCQQPSRSATLAALEARATRNPGATTVIDLDYRPMFWSSAAEATSAAREALRWATVAVGNREECEVAIGETAPDRAAAALLAAGLDLAVVKQGPAGVLGRQGETTTVVPPTPVEVVNGLGAGDAFGGALCHGLLAGWPLEQTLRFANTAGAIVASRLSCSEAMPTSAEVEALLATTPTPHPDPQESTHV